MQIDHPDTKAQCKRAGCDCSVASGQEFCSDHCRSAAGKEAAGAEGRDSCTCGHAECNAGEQRATS